jgi:lysozyme
MEIPQEVSSILLPLVKRFEGCRLESYQDTAGVWTIGYGHTGLEVVKGVVWTQERADAQLDVDLTEHYSQLLEVSPSVGTASPARQAALTDFVYNLGIGTYEHSTLRSAVDMGAWLSVIRNLALWVHSGGKVEPGLVKRRQAEIDLCH